MLALAHSPSFRIHCIAALALVAATTYRNGYATPTVQPYDVVATWNEALIRHALADRDARFDSGTMAYLLAVMHGAMREAIETRDRPQSEPAGESFRAAAGAATAHALLSVLLPEQRAHWERLLDDALRTLADGSPADDVIALGRHVSASWLDRHGYAAAAAAGSLGFSEPVPVWVRSARPFALRRRDQIRTASPNLNRVMHRHMLPPLRDRQESEDQPRSGDVSRIDRRFWAASPEEVWNHSMRNWAAIQKTDLRERARWFAVLNAALADAYLAAYESREHFRTGSWFLVFGRAANAIAGNDWTDELHVEATIDNYPNVSAVVNGTAEIILQSICGGDELTLVIRPSDHSPSSSPTYSRISAATRACARANSTACGDVFESCDAGYAQGRKLGRWITQRVH